MSFPHTAEVIEALATEIAKQQAASLARVQTARQACTVVLADLARQAEADLAAADATFGLARTLLEQYQQLAATQERTIEDFRQAVKDTADDWQRVVSRVEAERDAAERERDAAYAERDAVGRALGDARSGEAQAVAERDAAVRQAAEMAGHPDVIAARRAAAEARLAAAQAEVERLAQAASKPS